MRRTKPTAPSTTDRLVRMSSVSTSCRDRTDARQREFSRRAASKSLQRSGIRIWSAATSLAAA
ncbi:MAG: hypothetical protein ACREMQ_12580, partial [Longimicrobiales bacterium]